MQIFNFFYTYANFLPTIFKLSPNFIPKSLKITQFSPPPNPSENSFYRFFNFQFISVSTYKSGLDTIRGGFFARVRD